MCVLGQPEPVDSVLTFPSGYDTVEYSWLKATAVSVRLRILFVTLQSTNTRPPFQGGGNNFNSNFNSNQPSLRDLVFGQAKINESLNEKLAANDKVLENKNTKVETLSSALKN